MLGRPGAGPLRAPMWHWGQGWRALPAGAHWHSFLEIWGNDCRQEGRHFMVLLDRKFSLSR